MLAEMTPGEFDERWEHYKLDPWGDDWEMAGTIAATVTNAMANYIYAKAGKHLPASMIAKPEHFIPRELPATKKPSIKADDRMAAERIAKSLGCI